MNAPMVVGLRATRFTAYSVNSARPVSASSYFRPSAGTILNARLGSFPDDCRAMPKKTSIRNATAECHSETDLNLAAAIMASSSAAPRGVVYSAWVRRHHVLERGAVRPAAEVLYAGYLRGEHRVMVRASVGGCGRGWLWEAAHASESNPDRHHGRHWAACAGPAIAASARAPDCDGARALEDISGDAGHAAARACRRLGSTDDGAVGSGGYAGASAARATSDRGPGSNTSRCIRGSKPLGLDNTSSRNNEVDRRAEADPHSSARRIPPCPVERRSPRRPRAA